MIRSSENSKTENTYGISDELFLKVRNSVSLIDENIIVVDEIEKFNAATINVEFDRLEELVKGLDFFSQVILLDGCRRPDAKTRKVIIQRFSKLANRINHISYCVGKNLLIRTSISFVMHASGNDNFSITKTKEASLQNCRIWDT